MEFFRKTLIFVMEFNLKLQQAKYIKKLNKAAPERRKQKFFQV